MSNVNRPPCAWVFQANPKQFNLASALEAASPGEVDWWNATQRRALMRKGDVVVLWTSGPRAGAHAVCLLTTDPFEHHDTDEGPREEYELVPWRVEFRYLAIFDAPVLRTELMADPTLRELTILKSPQGTNFSVHPQLWPALRARLAAALESGGKGSFDEVPLAVIDANARKESAAHVATATGPDEDDENDGDGEGRWLGMGPLPGGVREYKRTLDDLLAWLHASPRTVNELSDTFASRYEITGRKALAMYVGRVLKTGYVERVGDALRVNADGVAYLATRDARVLFEQLHTRYTGLLELLTLAATPEGCTTRRALETLNEELGTAWRSNNQPSFRRNWLLSMGLTDRDDDVDRVTALGREVLRRHGIEAASEPPKGGPELPTSQPRGEPTGWTAERLDLAAARIAAHLGDLRISERVLTQIAAALSTGKHLLLLGPPGTGKTALARVLAEAARAEGYCRGLFVSTASADWSTFETIGGYAMTREQAFSFRPGVFLRALAEYQWLLVDELNRADVDRSFGELLTLLAGGSVDTPYLDDGGRNVSLGPSRDQSYFVAPSFRVIATMNTWDRSSLFRLSYALLRRFAVVTLDAPDEATLHAIIEQDATRPGYDPPVDAEATGRVKRLFSRDGLLRERALGPAMARDLVRYLRRRGGAADALAEGVEMFVLPQLDGLDREGATRVEEAVLAALSGAVSEGARAQLTQRLRELRGA